jgi:hypothetical protein
MPPTDQTSPPATAREQHTIRLRDLRKRFGEPEAWVAECSCGWRGDAYDGLNSDRSARREGMRHCDDAGLRDPAPGRDYYRRD